MISRRSSIFLHSGIIFCVAAGLYSTWTVTETSVLTRQNRDEIAKLQAGHLALSARMDVREAVAKTYIPRLERSEETVGLHGQLMQNIIERQKEIMRYYHMDLKKLPKK